MNDDRELVLSKLQKNVTARLTFCQEGILAGMGYALEKAKELGLNIIEHSNDGQIVAKGDSVLTLKGNPWQMVQGEDTLIGFVSKSSGVATAAYQALQLAGGSFKVVAGAWKKIPRSTILQMREAVRSVGMTPRLTDVPFLYLDKNIVRSCGGILSTLEAFRGIHGKVKSIQIKGETKEIAQEALDACKGGAGIIMVDTGELADLTQVIMTLKEEGVREQVKIAYSGGVNLGILEVLKYYDVDIVDVGAFIVDAPLLDLRYDIVSKA